MISNREIKTLMSLSTKKGRKESGKYLIEGFRITRSALRNKAPVLKIYITDKFKSSNDFQQIFSLIPKKVDVIVLEEKIIKSICQTLHPSGVFATCLLKNDIKKTKLIIDNCIYLDEVSDPGNLGTILRSAAWFGIKNVALSPKCVDVFNPKVVRSGMGAHFMLNILRNSDLHEFQKNNFCILGGDQNGSPMYDFYNNDKKWVLVIGSEGHGISETNKKFIDHFLSIPSAGSGDSLNASIAGSILMHHLINAKN